MAGKSSGVLLGMGMPEMDDGEAMNTVRPERQVFSIHDFIYSSEQAYGLDIVDSKFLRHKDVEKHFKTHSAVRNGRRKAQSRLFQIQIL